MTFNVGQKVVCVRRDPWASDPNKTVFPSRGQVYTVRGIDIGCCPEPAVWLCEIVNDPRRTRCRACGAIQSNEEPSFHVKNFRPLIERKTSTEIGMQILTDILKRETVEDRPRVPLTER